jgi:predicted negative regulator of RcsB-dependent stress response
LEPESGYIRDSLGWVYFKKGMYTEALVEIKKASELEGNDPVILEHLGDVYLKLGNKDAAQEVWKKSLEPDEKEEGFKERINKKLQDLNN